jgi:hypothetical protein
MGRSRRICFGLAVAVLAAPLAVGCGGSSHGKASHGKASHGTEAHGGEAAPALPPPTPDTTPIEALRTPAGLVLKIAPATTSTPAGATTPSPSVTAAPTTPTPAK